MTARNPPLQKRQLGAMSEVLTDDAFSPLMVPWSTVNDDFSLAAPPLAKAIRP